MSSSDQLERWAKKHIGESFRGVFCSDELAKAGTALHRGRDHFERSIIFNYDPTTRPGSHWIAIRITPTTLEYFDSYGQKPDAADDVLRDRTHFLEFCEQHAPRGTWTYNQLDLQALDSGTCGHYCLWFCKNGPPDPKNTDWLPIFEAGGQPPTVKNPMGLRRVDQTAAARRDAEITRLVRL